MRKKQSKLKVTSSFAFEVDLDMVDARSVCASGYIYIYIYIAYKEQSRGVDWLNHSKNTFF